MLFKALVGLKNFKGACSDSQPQTLIPPTFFQTCDEDFGARS